MDPVKQQTDTNNEVNSLEGAGTVVESPQTNEDSGQEVSANNNAIVAEDLDTSAEALLPDKPSLFKRIWQKFNVYLLLFILTVLVAIGITVALITKDQGEKRKADESITSQGLSDDALKQLANADVTVGNPKQILKVESNALFAGSILVRNDLEVAGNIKVGGTLQLPGLTVSGTGSFNQLQAETLAVSANATVQGSLTVRRGLSVTGNSTFDGVSAGRISTDALQLNGELKLTRHVTAGGAVPSSTRGNALGSGGTASVSGSDTSGSITINTGSGPSSGCFVTVKFAARFEGTPHVIVTPIGSAAADLSYYVNRSSTEFSVCATNAASGGQTFGFDYIILN